MAEPEPEAEVTVQGAVEEAEAPGALQQTEARATRAGDDVSPQKSAGSGPSEGKPLDKIIRTEVVEEPEGEGDDAQAQATGDSKLSLVLPDASAADADSGAEGLDRMDTPSSGLIHRSSTASLPGTTATPSPVRDPVGKVHAVTKDLTTTPSAQGAPSLGSLPDAGDAECKMPSDAPVAAVSEPAAKTPWPGQDDDDDDDEEEEEEGDAFGFEDGMDTLGEMHAAGQVPVRQTRQRADTGAGGALMGAAGANTTVDTSGK